MDKKEIEAFAREAAKMLKTEQDLTDFRQILTKVTVEAALNAELDEHLGYGKHRSSSLRLVAMKPTSLRLSAIKPTSLRLIAVMPTSLRLGAIKPTSLRLIANKPTSLRLSAG